MHYHQVFFSLHWQMVMEEMLDLEGTSIKGRNLISDMPMTLLIAESNLERLVGALCEGCEERGMNTNTTEGRADSTTTNKVG